MQSYSGLSGEPLYIEFPMSLSPKGNITQFSPICIHWEETNGCLFVEWKGWGGEVVTCFNLDNQQLWKKRAHN